MNKISQFWQELKRRNVVRRNAVYAGAAFVILELVSILVEPFGLPDWTLKLVVVFLSIGFIVSIILSWIYDFNPEGGLEKTKPVQKVKKEDVRVTSAGWKIASYLSFVVIVALIILNMIPRTGGSKDLQNAVKSIAVLPFEDMSREKDQEYFCDGMSDEIIYALTNIPGLKVIARTSAFAFKGKHEDMREIGIKLDVETLLSGSIRKDGNRLRISAQLIKVSDGSHLWSDTYDRNLEGVFDLQQEISIAIADNLKINLFGEKQAAIEQQPAVNIEAYNLYLQGRYFWNKGGASNFDKSIEYYSQALEIDPDYALAYSGLAATFTSYAWGGARRKDYLPQAIKAAKKALELDYTLGEAHAELAHARVVYDWDWTGGEVGFKHALELNPNYAMAHDRYAWLLSFVGRHDEAIHESKRAHELDPLSYNIWRGLGSRYYYARDFDRAIEEYRKVLEMYPNSGAQVGIALALLAKGLQNEAMEVCSKIESMSSNIGFVYGIAGNKEKAQEILNYHLERSKNRFVWPAAIAIIYIGLGEKDNAFEWLEKAYDQREALLDLLKVDPKYDSLRSDPRFQDLVERMNFPDY